MAKIVVLVSGGGSNLQAIIDAVAAGQINATIAAVIADRECFGLTRARNNNIPAYLVDRKIHKAGLSVAVAEYIPKDCSLIVLAGFLSILSDDFINRYSGKIINIHPSLLPRHGGAGMWGLNVHKAVLAAGDKASGCTVHYVTSEIDGGAVIAQTVVAVLVDDTPEQLQARVLSEEHQLLVSVVKQLISTAILEVATLNIIAGKNKEFEQTFLQATPLIQGCRGYLCHELQQCLEVPSQYLLLVWWESLEAHTIGFRNSTEYQQWKELLHKFYDPFPTVVHYRKLI